jgi:hypothetical protein
VDVDVAVRPKVRVPKSLQGLVTTRPLAPPVPPPAEVPEGRVPLDFVPTNEAELERCLADPHWRLGSGYLYKIMVKSSEDDEGTIVPFLPNRAQRRLVARFWHRRRETVEHCSGR